MGFNSRLHAGRSKSGMLCDSKKDIVDRAAWIKLIILLKYVVIASNISENTVKQLHVLLRSHFGWYDAYRGLPNISETPHIIRVPRPKFLVTRLGLSRQISCHSSWLPSGPSKLNFFSSEKITECHSVSQNCYFSANCSRAVLWRGNTLGLTDRMTY